MACESGDGDLIDLSKRTSLRGYLGQLWNTRDFVVALPLTNIKAEHQNHILGDLWMVLNPLLFSAVFYVIFGVLLQTREGIENFPLFLITGMFVFQFTSRSVSGGMRSINANVALLQSLRFPRASLPVASTLGDLLAHVPGLAVIVATALLTGAAPSAAWLLLAPATLVQTAFNAGLALIAARVAYHFRDAEQFVPHLLRIWLYVSGVVFSVDLVAQRAGDTALTLFEANPMWIFLRMHRDAVLQGSFTVSTWAWGIGLGVVSLTCGLVFFQRREEEYGDV
jgi:teichoic acid transport system permease protein